MNNILQSVRVENSVSLNFRIENNLKQPFDTIFCNSQSKKSLKVTTVCSSRKFCLFEFSYREQFKTTFRYNFLREREQKITQGDNGLFHEKGESGCATFAFLHYVIELLFNKPLLYEYFSGFYCFTLRIDDVNEV